MECVNDIGRTDDPSAAKQLWGVQTGYEKKSYEANDR
jgi:hypothetical protein